jgi:hypothetical protein
MEYRVTYYQTNGSRTSGPFIRDIEATDVENAKTMLRSKIENEHDRSGYNNPIIIIEKVKRISY